ncbi:NEL-type E3 ubiquitin ligase domain-containing protein [Salmonella enterica]|uniref:NEL-type E3 ubiquitin ligase domain-containing protein n=1 Tax=Salmonella enterica TaxID=28901 RepID=UPI001E62100A|nr:NEL-type E3 ubiquitin ligase domain-containing protein [Salmonella enterica]
MPLHVGSGCLPATITNLRINCIAQSATPPEMSLWEKIKEFFCSTHQTEAQECIWTICHPSVGTTREDVVSRFEQLRMLVYAGYEESIHSGRHGESHFCILDADNQEILSVTLDDAGNYTVNCQGHNETYRFTMDIEQGEECTEHAEGASGTLQVSPLPDPAAPQTPAAYDAVWSEWKRAAPAEELRGRAATVQRICTCLNNGSRELNVGESGLTALPDCLPAHITTLVIPHNNYLTSLPTLPSGLEVLTVEDNQLTSLPPLPAGLVVLTVSGNQLTSLPPLPAGLQTLSVAGNQLTSLPPLPAGLQMLSVAGNQLTRLPPLPAGLRRLLVAGNQLTSLPPLPAGLQMLSVAGNQLTRLPPLPAGLRRLLVAGNQLTSLPPLPAGLQMLSVAGNQLTRLPPLPAGLRRLLVAGNQLTSLPPLPAGLQMLSVAGNQLTRLPPLPAGLRRLLVAGNQLTSLPPLPAGLQMLLVARNQLTSLPPLPAGLQMLSVAGNQLTRLPPLPAGLRRLLVAGNQLTSLPPLPAGLQVLSVSDNQLTSLPLLPAGLELLTLERNPQLVRLPPLPEGLQTLSVDANPQLTRLPALPSGLQRLYARNNQLTRLPESITGLSSEASVNLEGNPLSERTLQALREITSAPGYSGPRILFDMAGASAPREARALHLAAAGWLVPAREGEPAPADRWHMFGQEDNAAAFSLFLDRLSETENFMKDAGFKAQISSWLVQLAEDEALRAKTFAMATEATASCQDRVTLALHQMKNVQLVHDAEKGQYDNNLAALVATGREMFRLEKLEQIAREKAGTLALADDVEVYLAYQNKLKKALGLTSVTAEMRFFGVSGVTVSDLQAAELQVKAAEKSELREWILQWGPLHSVLERKAPERVNALREKQISDYEETYRMLSDTELRPFGLVGNTDAERTIGARAMESAKKTFLDGLRPLVEEMLGSYLAP